MAYGKVGPWVNGGAPPISAANLDTIETQYELAVADILVPVVVRKTANQIVNNSNVLVNDTHLLYAIAASEEWVYQFVLYITGNVAAGLKAAITVPALCTLRWGFSSAQAAGGVAVMPVVQTISGNSSSVEVDGTPAAHIIELWVLNGANAGSVQLQWAQQAAHGSDLTVYQGSHLVAHQLA